LYPAFLDPPDELVLANQFAFRPTVSTTAVIISLFHKITTLLASEPYVIVLALDFSKDFDRVCHSMLMEKMASLNLPDHVYNWLTDFIQHHSHCVKFRGVSSAQQVINASIVQGSAVGPASYVINAADLNLVTSGNYIVKYADDTYLIIPASNHDSRLAELANVKSWSEANNIQLNYSKSAEVVFFDPRRKAVITEPTYLDGINRVASLKVLGVTVSRKLSVSDHVGAVLQSCARALYAIRVLRSHGLPNSDLQNVFRAIVVAKLTYASSAWVGFATVRDIQRVDAFLRRCNRAGLCGVVNFSDLCDSADEQLFNKILQNKQHTLAPILPNQSLASQNYNLRSRSHFCQLVTKTTKTETCNFLNRMLFKNSY